ncbi:MAG: hypothetical protein ACNA8P_08645 [Phycisphaerales bacterium]
MPERVPGKDVPLGLAIDDRPERRRSRAATNDAADRRKAFLLIGGILILVLVLVLIGSTVLAPWIRTQREQTVIRVTQDQVETLADLAEERFLATGGIVRSFDELRDDKVLETSKGTDLWGHPFRISSEPGPDPSMVVLIVASAGPDGQLGTSDDIVAERVLRFDDRRDESGLD